MSRRRSWALASGFFAIAVAALGLSAYSGASSSQGFAPVQPVNFPHPRHVRQLGMNCLYCHYAANRSPDPGLPAVGTCMAELILDGAARTVDIRAFRPQRFAEGTPLVGPHPYVPHPDRAARPGVVV